VPDLLAARCRPVWTTGRRPTRTLCAIALQAVRQTEARLGERVLVMGQGLVGLLVTNFLQAAGARVMAVDLAPSRRLLCPAMGAERTVILGEQNLSTKRAPGRGFGVDAAVILHGDASNAPIEQAAEVIRRTAAAWWLWATPGPNLPGRFFTKKSSRCGIPVPTVRGATIRATRWAGIDYPIGYVRWTEQRNFQACLDLMAKGRIHLAALTTRRARFADALSFIRI